MVLLIGRSVHTRDLMISYLSCWLQSQPPTLCDNYLEKTRRVGLTGARETIELPIKIWFVPASVDLHNPFCSYVLSTQTYLHNFSHDVFVCGKTNILLWDSGLLSQRIAPLFSYFLVLYCTVYMRPACHHKIVGSGCMAALMDGHLPVSLYSIHLCSFTQSFYAQRGVG